MTSPARSASPVFQFRAPVYSVADQRLVDALQATTDWDVAAVEAALQEGANPNLRLGAPEIINDHLFLKSADPLHFLLSHYRFDVHRHLPEVDGIRGMAVAERLIAHGADLHALSRDGDTLTAHALRLEESAWLPWLLAHGAPLPGGQDASDQPPLHHLVGKEVRRLKAPDRHRHVAVLLAHGASMEALDEERRTAFDWALFRTDCAVAHTFLSFHPHLGPSPWNRQWPLERLLTSHHCKDQLAAGPVLGAFLNDLLADTSQWVAQHPDLRTRYIEMLGRMSQEAFSHRSECTPNPRLNTPQATAPRNEQRWEAIAALLEGAGMDMQMATHEVPPKSQRPRL